MQFLYLVILCLLININVNHVSAHSCVTCEVFACSSLVQETLYVELPGHPPVSSNQHSEYYSCDLLNSAILFWLQTDSVSSCSSLELAELACEQLVVMNQTQTGCESESMAADPKFHQRCQSLVQCDIPGPERILRTDACRASNAFVDALRFDVGPVSSSNCLPCRLRACDGWSTPSRFTTKSVGKVELYLSMDDLAAGITCELLENAVHVLTNAPADTASPLSRTAALNATCFPLAQASVSEWGSDFCGLSAQLYTLYDVIVFEQLPKSRGALTWPYVCPKYLHSVYELSIAEQLKEAGYCNSPTTGLLNLVAQLSLNSSDSSTGIGPGSSNNAVTNSFWISAVVVTLMWFTL